MRVTIRDVARAAGVGVTTVSRALNNKEGVSATTAARVRHAAEKLGYRPNLSARLLRSARSEVVTVVLKGPANPFFTQILELIERRLREDGFVVSIVRVGHDEDELEAALRAASASRICGMIMLGGWHDAGASGWARVPVPAVLCTVPEIVGVDPGEYSSVSVDNAHAMRLVVNHLADLGHERIAFLGPAEGDESIGAIRMRHFAAAMLERGLEAHPSLMLRGASPASAYSYEYGARTTREFFGESPGGSRAGRVTAIVGMSDAIAVGAMRALADAGVRVPNDVCVTGFDGIDITAYTNPRLTTIRQPIEEIARETCALLLRKIDGGAEQHVILPGELVVAESTGVAGGSG